jgi:hypothetical protein
MKEIVVVTACLVLLLCVCLAVSTGIVHAVDWIARKYKE